MAENQFFIDSDKLSEAALERKHKLETDPSSRTNHMEYMPVSYTHLTLPTKA